VFCNLLATKKMTKEEAVKYYNPVLRRKAQSVALDEESKKTIERMKKVLKEEDGVGLAAPQIGESKKIIVINAEDGMFALLNPEIKEKSKESFTTKEGCLSIPGIWLDIARSKKVRVRALNEEGREMEIEGEDIFAVVLQHEIDHLHGKLFIDRAGTLVKWRSLVKYYFKKYFGNKWESI